MRNIDRVHYERQLSQETERAKRAQTNLARAGIRQLAELYATRLCATSSHASVEQLR